MSDNEAAAVTEPPAELYWFDGEGNGLEVRPGGAIRLHHGGYVVTKPLRDWLLLACPLRDRGIHAKPGNRPAPDVAAASRPDEKGASDVPL